MEAQGHRPAALSDIWRILIIDDDEDDYIIVRDMLKEARGKKFEIRWAASYETAWEELFANHFSAVLVDYDLGRLTGIELIREVNQRDYPAPLILYTGRGNYEVDVEAMEAGATLYLSKGEANPLLLERAIRYAIELKQKERSLRLSEERFQSAFDASPNAQVISRLETGQIEVINASFEHLFGYRREEVLGKTSLELNLFANPADREAAVRQLQADKRLRNFELDIRTKSGDIRHASLSIEMIPVGSEHLMLTVIQDITESKRAVAKLAYQAMLLQNVHDAVVASDASQIVTFWNQGAERLYGWTSAEALGRPVWEMIPVEWTEAQRQAARRDLLERGGFVGSMVQYARDGRKMWVECRGIAVLDAAGQVTSLISANRDITELKEIQDALRQSEEKYRTYFDQLHETVTVFEAVRSDSGAIIDWIYRDVNQAGLQMLGFRPDQVIGRTVSQVLGTEILSRFNAVYRQVLETGQTAHHDTAYQGRHFLVSISRIDQNRVASIGLDITDRKRAEEEG